MRPPEADRENLSTAKCEQAQRASCAGSRDIFLRVEGDRRFGVASRQRDVPRSCEFKGGVGPPGGRRLRNEESVLARMLSASVRSGQSAVSPLVTSVQPRRRANGQLRHWRLISYGGPAAAAHSSKEEGPIMKTASILVTSALLGALAVPALGEPAGPAAKDGAHAATIPNFSGVWVSPGFSLVRAAGIGGRRR